ncbi:MAG: NAD-dependent epimerase/dehydratase family protein [Candidatus Omnitrophica bacterium]|nr:NAD-dependent epimerase/dehydratase family protein [Candidatus Omnitrophota bacterium]
MIECFEGKTCLVTGGAGFIGSHLADRLVSLGAKKVIAMDNLAAGSLDNLGELKAKKNFELEVKDVRDFEAVRKLVKISDFVFHLAASKLVVSLKDPRIDLETNIFGMFNILEAAKEKKPRIVYASTGSVLGSSDKPMKEDYPGKPSTVYGISKRAAEDYCRFYTQEFGLKISTIRYFHVFGPRQDYDSEAGVVSIFLGRVLEGRPPVIFGTGEQVRCFTYVGDEIDATLLMASSPQAIGGVYNVASRSRVTVKELAELIIRKYAKVPMKPVFAEPRRGENMRPIPDTKKIEALGFREKVSFSEGLESTKRWVEETQKKRREGSCVER